MISRAINTFKRVFISWKKSNFNLVKIHAMSHYVDSIHKSETPFEYNANLYISKFAHHFYEINILVWGATIKVITHGTLQCQTQSMSTSSTKGCQRIWRFWCPLWMCDYLQLGKSQYKMYDLKLCQKVSNMPSCKSLLHHVICVNALLTSNLMWNFLHVLCVRWTKWLILAF